MIIGIVIDSWKLTIFARRLTKGGFSYKKCPGLTSNTFLLQVKALTGDELLEIVKAADQEATNSKNRN